MKILRKDPSWLSPPTTPAPGTSTPRTRRSVSWSARDDHKTTAVHRYTGSFTIDPENRNNSANVVIQAASVDTGDENRDNHVRTGDFFEVEKYPEITFVATDAKVTGDNEGVLTGDLTIKGVTKSIDLDVEFEGTNVDAYDLERIGLTATGSINRKEFGVDWQAPLNSGVMVSDKVVLEIEVSAVKA